VETWDAIRARRNVRSYDQRAIAPQDLDRILEAARRAPSAGNQQAWDFVVCTDREQLTRLARVGPPPATSPARRRRSRWWPPAPTIPSCAT
jgi:nitroreductase